MVVIMYCLYSLVSLAFSIVIACGLGVDLFSLVYIISENLPQDLLICYKLGKLCTSSISNLVLHSNNWRITVHGFFFSNWGKNWEMLICQERERALMSLKIVSAVKLCLYHTWTTAYFENPIAFYMRPKSFAQILRAKQKIKLIS